VEILKNTKETSGDGLKMWHGDSGAKWSKRERLNDLLIFNFYKVVVG
jgi:hypothetical protein